MFCNQCGTQLPENAEICPNCGVSITSSSKSAQQNQTVLNNQPAQQGQPAFNGQPMQQGQPAFNGQPMQQGQPMYNARPGYGAPVQNSNPLAFITAKHPGETFPFKGLFSVKNLISKITTIDLIGVISALVAFICVFLPLLSASGESISLISKDMREAGFKIGWLILVVSVAMMVLYILRMEVLAFLLSVINLLLFVSVWTFCGVFKTLAGFFTGINYGVGFYFYLLATVAAVAAPFIWIKVKKD